MFPVSRRIQEWPPPTERLKSNSPGSKSRVTGGRVVEVVVVAVEMVVVGGEVVGTGAVVVVDCSVVVGEAPEGLGLPRRVEVLSDGMPSMGSVPEEAGLSVAVVAGAETELSEASLQLEANNAATSKQPNSTPKEIAGRIRALIRRYLNLMRSSLGEGCQCREKMEGHGVDITTLFECLQDIEGWHYGFLLQEPFAVGGGEDDLFASFYEAGRVASASRQGYAGGNIYCVSAVVGMGVNCERGMLLALCCDSQKKMEHRQSAYPVRAVGRVDRRDVGRHQIGSVLEFCRVGFDYCLQCFHRVVRSRTAYFQSQRLHPVVIYQIHFSRPSCTPISQMSPLVHHFQFQQSRGCHIFEQMASQAWVVYSRCCLA